MLLACKCRARHNEDTLLIRGLALLLIDTANGLQREGIAQRAPRATCDLMLVVALTRIEEVGIGRVHPPRIGAVVEEFLQMFPVNIACHRTEGIVDLHARGIVHAGRPDVGDATLRPGLDRQQETHALEFAELLGLRSEACPDGDHEVSMLLMDVLNHLRSLGKVLSEEVHRIPLIVGAPVLPVLDDAVEGHLQLAVLVDDALRLGSSLITLLRLPEAVGPKWEHRDIACEVTYLCDHAIGRTAIHKVVVDSLACLGGQRHTVGIVVELCGRIILPIESPALDRLQHALEVLEVRLFHTLMFTTTIDLTILDGSKAIDRLILVESEGLAYLGDVAGFLAQQHLALGIEEGQVALRILLHCQGTT